MTPKKPARSSSISQKTYTKKDVSTINASISAKPATVSLKLPSKKIPSKKFIRNSVLSTVTRTIPTFVDASIRPHPYNENSQEKENFPTSTKGSQIIVRNSGTNPPPTTKGPGLPGKKHK